MARKYTEVVHASGRDSMEGIFDIHVVTGYGGPVHLVISGDSEALVENMTHRMVAMLEDHLIVEPTPE
jgi:hypothetical protein